LIKRSPYGQAQHDKATARHEAQLKRRGGLVPVTEAELGSVAERELRAFREDLARRRANGRRKSKAV
jgi:hypothetical protein